MDTDARSFESSGYVSLSLVFKKKLLSSSNINLQAEYIDICSLVLLLSYV